MSIQPQPYYRFEDYLAVEREYLDAKQGEVFAMAGASYHHHQLDSIGCALPLREVYDKVEFVVTEARPDAGRD